ncbi:MAG: 2-oxoacid:acceptor oxidoreductase family protein [Deltaproteobacteria bacterium]|nr:2-oxoacid:acceptor oxidoreductase family protein [Deltaproteobacteria bacterium]
MLASQILGSAFFKIGNWVQSFPSFGAERRGAPVSAFLRVDTKEITLRYGVKHPEWLVLFDPGLVKNKMVMDGVRSDTSIIVNSTEPAGKGRFGLEQRLFIVDATSIAEGLNLRTTSFSIVNTAMVGAFAKASGLIDLDSVSAAIGELVPVKKEENIAAAKEAYGKVKEVSL